MSFSNEVFKLRKEHRIEDALIKARAGFAEDPRDLWLQRAYGWVLFDLLKSETASLEPDGSTAHLSRRFDELLREYQQFAENVRPDILHSQILAQALKASKVWRPFLAFARWWGPEYFRDEDQQPYRPPEGREVPSLARRYAYAVGREALRHAASTDPELLRWAEAQIDLTLQQAPNDQWLHYYKSQFLLSRNQSAQALEHLLPVLNRQQNAAWVWSLFGHIQEPQDPEKAIICYQRAVQLARKPDEVANTRIALAKLLALRERYEEATFQVRQALEYRTKSNYRIPQALSQLAGSDWYRSLSGSKDLPRELDVSRQAASILAANLEDHLLYRVGIIDNQNPSKALAHVAFSLDDGVVLPYRRFLGIDNLPVATMVEVGYSDGGSQPLRWRTSHEQSIDGFLTGLSGPVRKVDGHEFGFMESQQGARVFVPPDLMMQYDGDRTSEPCCIAVMAKDRKGRKGWRALRWVDAGQSLSDLA